MLVALARAGAQGVVDAGRFEGKGAGGARGGDGACEAVPWDGRPCCLAVRRVSVRHMCVSWPARVGDACPQDGKSPCYISAQQGNDKCLAMLIEKGCDVNTPDKARAGREWALAQ